MNEAAEALNADDSGLLFCGASPAQLARARARIMRWNQKRELSWCIADRLAGMTIEQQVADTKWAFQQWHEATNGFFTYRQIANSALADIVLTTRRIDRPGGVLAEMQLPPGDDRQIIAWMDVSEQWNRSVLYKIVLLHELGHGMGMDHITIPGTVAVLNPTYNPNLQRLQSADVNVLLGIYPEAASYKPDQPTFPAGPTPTPPPDSITIQGVVTPFGTYGPGVLPRVL